MDIVDNDFFMDWMLDEGLFDLDIDKAKLIYITREIIQELPESQQQFYRDLFVAKRSQYRVAKIYGITPQAVTNRLKKLKNTISKKCFEKTGCMLGEISDILDKRSLSQSMDDYLDANTKMSRHETIKVNGVYKERRVDAELLDMIGAGMHIEYV